MGKQVFHLKTQGYFILMGLFLFLITACQLPWGSVTAQTGTLNPAVETPLAVNLPTQLPARPEYLPGELVGYTAQTGDSLPALAEHFNTTVAEIRTANPGIPDGVTTLPPGFPMQIPIYYQPFWGSSYQIIPDSLFINGPAQIGFDPVAYVNAQPGWFKNYQVYAGEDLKTGGEIIAHVAQNFSVSPRLLLTLIEYQTHALTLMTPPSEEDIYPLGLVEQNHKGLYLQLILAANMLNNGYYGWRTAELESFDHKIDGLIEKPDPWQNAASVALQYFFAQVLGKSEYDLATGPEGFVKTYRELFGPPWENVQPHIPGSLEQPAMQLPFEQGKTWAYTGGPHTGWGEGLPYAAIDFAPPSTVSGCSPSNEWVTAIADGLIVRSGSAVAVLDLDGDGDERTGWVVFYLHLSSLDMVKNGTPVIAGQIIGHPSCEGGEASGTHIHIARKYNGEWISAGGVLAFNLDSWVAAQGSTAYEGTLTRFSKVIQACECSDQGSQIETQP